MPEWKAPDIAPACEEKIQYELLPRALARKIYSGRTPGNIIGAHK
jgi:hypothetical protein